MVQWVCTRCNYRFDVERPLGCPYCGRDNDCVEKEKGAEELLDEVDRLLKN